MDKDPLFLEVAEASLELDDMPLELLYYISRISAGTLMSLAQVLPVIAELAKKDYVWKALFERDFPNEFSFCGGYVPFYVIDPDRSAFAWIANRKDAASDGPAWKRYYLHIRQLYVETARRFGIEGNNFNDYYRGLRQWIDRTMRDEYHLFINYVLWPLVTAIASPDDASSFYHVVRILHDAGIQQAFDDVFFRRVVEENIPSIASARLDSAARIVKMIGQDRPIFLASSIETTLHPRREQVAYSFRSIHQLIASCMWVARYVKLRTSFRQASKDICIVSMSKPFLDGLLPGDALEELFLMSEKRRRGQSTQNLRSLGYNLFGEYLRLPRNEVSDKIVYMQQPCASCKKDASHVEKSSRAPRFFCDKTCQTEYHEKRNE